ncbi:MAG: SIS domain-containing protein [Acidobacteriota bacterium]|nr:SIS domain-containing protein [Acidobacteriota bacterium]
MSTPLLENILNQPKAFQQVADYQLGAGRPALARAADLLRSKKRIVLSGMGASHFACLPFQYLLAGLGLHAIAVEAAELLYFLPSLIDRDTVVVLVSRSGESVEITKLLPLLNHRAASVLGVANIPDSKLIASADEALLLNSPPDQMVAIQTYTGTVVLFSLLAAALSNELHLGEAALRASIEILARWIPECVTASEEWRPFLEIDSPLYLLGRGAALGTVAEGVLLMHETAKTPAIGMSAAQFRHGPVEVTDGNFRGIVIGTQPATAQLDVALARDLKRMGGHVRWIGPAVPGFDLLPLVAWPTELPHRFAPIAEIVPLQLAAYLQAEVNGVRPGDFRWAPLVTTTEAGFSLADK